jgi:hypothetical protein
MCEMTDFITTTSNIVGDLSCVARLMADAIIHRGLDDVGVREEGFSVCKSVQLI